MLSVKDLDEEPGKSGCLFEVETVCIGLSHPLEMIHSDECVCDPVQQ